MIEHRTIARFWEFFNGLPEDIQAQAIKAYKLMEENPFHPSLHLKAVGIYWSARASLHCRALASRRGDIFTWFWIGSHREYEKLIR